MVCRCDRTCCEHWQWMNCEQARGSKMSLMLRYIWPQVCQTLSVLVDVSVNAVCRSVWSTVRRLAAWKRLSLPSGGRGVFGVDVNWRTLRLSLLQARSEPAAPRSREELQHHIHTASWICLLRLYKDTASSWYCIEIWFVLMYKLDDTCRQNHGKCKGQLIECTLGVFVIVLD